MTSWPTPRSSVAENSSRCPPAGVASRIRVTAGMKPRSAMWSASSRTVISMSSRVHAPRSSRSIRRPGVATTRSTPRRIRSIWRPMDTPPYTVVTETSMERPRGSRTSATWTASSRVGTSTRPRGAFSRRQVRRVVPRRSPPGPPWRWLASRARAGRPKASVLPDPVWALPSTSRPLRASGSARDWMANGAWMPCSARILTSGAGIPRAANVVGSGAGSAAAASRARSSSDCGGGAAARRGACWRGRPPVPRPAPVLPRASRRRHADAEGCHA